MTRRRHHPLARTLWITAIVAAPVVWALVPQPSPAADPDTQTTVAQTVRVPGGEQRVTLRLRDMDVTDALKLIAARARISLSVAPDVTGKVDFDFYDETINRILATVLDADGLQLRQIGNTYIVSKSPADGLSGVRVFQLSYANADALSKLVVSTLKSAGISAGDQIIPDARSNSIVASGNPYFIDQVARLIKRLDLPQQHRIFKLNYVKAEDAAALLSTSVFGGASAGGAAVGGLSNVKFIPILRDNSLMVVGSADDLKLAADVIEKIDHKLRQVLIEVKLIELNGTANNVLGVSFNGQTGTLNGSWDASNGGLSVGYDPLKQQLAQLKVQLSALVTEDKARLLASPTILALDSKQSSIEITDDIISQVQTETTVNANNVIQTKNVTLGTAGITLQITPKINPDGYVSLDVKPEISFIRDQVNSGSDILATLKSTRKLSTPEVRVRDGETLIMGGLNQERIQDNVSKVPVLGDIPLIGGVFRSINKTRTTTELIVMITPKIVPEGPMPRSVR